MTVLFYLPGLLAFNVGRCMGTCRKSICSDAVNTNPPNLSHLQLSHLQLHFSLLQQVTCSKMRHLQQNHLQRPLAAKKTTCSEIDHLQPPFSIIKFSLPVSYFAKNVLFCCNFLYEMSLISK